MITIVDYGFGNVGAFFNVFERLGVESQVTAEPRCIEKAEKLILPGVGAFDAAMQSLLRSDLVVPLEAAVFGRAVPILGVCLGMQLFAGSSEEGGLAGLGWIPGRVQRLRPLSNELKVPNVGWREVTYKAHPSAPLGIFPPAGRAERYYFVHSYHCLFDDPQQVRGVIDHGGEVCVAVQSRNIFGVQFHPEKSHAYGLRLLKQFAVF
jgi:glutamine amidotransferase